MAVAGHPTEPMVFYFGACAGGVWKTTDGGTYWVNVSDGFFKTAAVGAIAVSESDPNVVYAGMGESCIRGDVSHGDGVYRSTDGGNTWKHLGLSDTRHIGRVRVDPEDPDLVYVAALGHAFGPNGERGVFRSSDGGESWDHLLFKSEKAGAVDLSIDPSNPRVIYATVWEAQRYPWTLKSGGPDSGLYRSEDRGRTWRELTDRPGLPEGVKGRIGVAASGAKPGRVWAIVEAEEGGLFRSDDAGDTWERTNGDRSIQQRPWYYSHVFADPREADTVYALSFKIWKSTDGGKTVNQVTTPHGDTHDLWIDPNDNRRMINGNDGGACVSFNGGETWSTIYNQPTAQFYHVVTDNQYPYHVYSTQQDNTAIAVPSRSYKGAILFADCYPVGSAESGHIAVRPDDHNIAYSGGIGSSPGGGDCLLRYDHRTGQVRIISVWPEYYYGSGVKDHKYRFQWTYPIVISPHDPNVLHVAAHVVLRSEDEGSSWEVISPDLTRNDVSKMGPAGGPITKDTTGVEHYGTIFALAESPHERGVFWAGSDDGLVHISRDGSKTWEQVTPGGLPEWSLVSMIEASPHEPVAAYVAATRYKLDDTLPYLYKTSDYGKSWVKITDGIPEHDFTRVIREDPVRRGLLFAGTETGVYVSFDDGGSWQSLQRNLPEAPVHDLTVKGDDLVVATHGRSFWILDDLTVLRQLDGQASGSSAHLFKPATTDRIAPEMGIARTYGPGNKYMMGLGIAARYHEGKNDQGEDIRVFLDAGTNPPDGVVVTYYLREKPESEVTLEFADSEMQAIRKFSSEPPEKGPEIDDALKEPVVRAEAGMNRFIWNMRHTSARPVPSAEEVEKTLAGPLVPPGEYQARLTVGDMVRTQSFELVADPRITATTEDLEEQRALLLRIRDRLSEVHDAVGTIRSVRNQVDEWVARAEGSKAQGAVGEAADELKGKLAAVEEELVQVKFDGENDALQLPSRLNRKLAELARAPASADAAPTQPAYDVFDDLSARVEEEMGKLRELIDTDVDAFINLVHEMEVPAVVPGRAR